MSKEHCNGVIFHSTISFPVYVFTFIFQVLKAVPWQGSPVPPGRGVPTIRRGPTIYIVSAS